MQEVHVPTPFADINELAESFAPRIDHERLMLPYPEAVLDGDWVQFRVTLENGGVVLEGVGRCTGSYDNGPEHPPEYRFDVVIDEIQLEGDSDAYFQHILAYKNGEVGGAEQAAEADVADVDDAFTDEPGDVSEPTMALQVSDVNLGPALDAIDAAAEAAPDPYAQDAYAPQEAAQDPYAQDAYAPQEAAQDPYAQDAYAQDPYAQQEAPQDAYAPQEAAQDPYAQDAYAQDPYAQDAHAAEPAADVADPWAAEAPAADVSMSDVSFDEAGSAEEAAAGGPAIPVVHYEYPTVPYQIGELPKPHSLDAVLTRYMLEASWEPLAQERPDPRPASGYFQIEQEAGLPFPERPPRPELDPSMRVSPAPRPGADYPMPVAPIRDDRQGSGRAPAPRAAVGVAAGAEQAYAAEGGYEEGGYEEGGYEEGAEQAYANEEGYEEGGYEEGAEQAYEDAGDAVTYDPSTQEADIGEFVSQEALYPEDVSIEDGTSEVELPPEDES